jgi:uncharacterized delta-60 repeat protein
MKNISKTIFITLLVMIFISPVSVFAAEGALDTAFNTGTGFNNEVIGITTQVDGKVIVSGIFTEFNGDARNGIARLNSDGSLDTSFNPGLGGLGRKTFIISNGKILYVGFFTSFNGVPAKGIIKLNQDGSIDPSLNSTIGVNGDIRHAAELSDGKIIIAGTFTNYNGISRNRIARLNSDGSLDISFDPGLGADNFIREIATTPDGKIVIIGGFTSYNGISRNRIARLNSDGSLDTTFDPGLGIETTRTPGSFTAWPVELQSDGKILIAGDFTSYNGVPRNGIARLNTDGSLDTTFDPGLGINLGGATDLRGLKIYDNKIYLSGSITSYGGITRESIVRINFDGSLDTSFNSGSIAHIQDFDFTSNKTMYLGGFFTTHNGNIANRISRIFFNVPSTPITTPDLTTPSDTGTSNNDNITNDTTPTFDVACTAVGNTINLYVDGVVNGTHICTAVGTEQVTTTTTLTDGIKSITYTESNGGGESAQSPALSITIDTTPSTTPTIQTPTDGTPITGSTSPNTQITITTTNGSTCTTTSDATGAYTCDLFPQPVNGETVTVTATDEAGNTSQSITTISLGSQSGPSSGGSYSTYVWNGVVINNNNNTSPTSTTNTITTPTTTTPTTTPLNTFISPLDNKTQLTCNPFRNYLKLNSKTNNIDEVKLWQAFLNKYNNESLPITGYYGPLTSNAIKRFQLKYKDEILTPWNLTNPTGYTYKTTRAKGNSLLGCSEGELLLDNGNKVDIK